MIDFNSLLSKEALDEFVEYQLMSWNLASDNFANLRNTQRRKLTDGEFECYAQLNPARIKSTAAKVEKDSISERPCFLCENNRPKEQISLPIAKDWKLLLNPYPIFARHFTIANDSHVKQGKLPLEMASFAEKLPGMAVFYNGARAGASAPDHRHAQAVMACELPIIKLAEKFHRTRERGFKSSETYGIGLPFHFISAIVSPDESGLKTLAVASDAFGIDEVTGQIDYGLINAFYWIDSENLLRIIIIPRKSHRPSCYFASGEEHCLISPGAIDMAGLVITPRKEDFEKIDDGKLKEIYSQVAFSDSLPEIIRNHFSV